ncbi:hypothetical protein CORC01_14438 [Colletotrichum orchidophilum]|uniref:Uncharacterized protein n=1 Tax=Colletotrichum orchidophilum TaxID=1209926 RepID=A0A1G4AM73_9PEZI|nr:uncharacterized protein CORC01_14438 [Colletotrichum orchidophilum]OHE90269.1 hypothetical protein CORC01_14438 [Colletotrichum orchidophilum]
MIGKGIQYGFVSQERHSSSYIFRMILPSYTLLCACLT